MLVYQRVFDNEWSWMIMKYIRVFVFRKIITRLFGPKKELGRLERAGPEKSRMRWFQLNVVGFQLKEIEFGLREYLEEIVICTTILKSIQWLMIHDMHFRFWARHSSDHMVKCLKVRNIDAVMLNYIPSHTSLRNATYAHLANLALQPTLNHLSSVQNPSIIPLYCLVYKHSPIGNDPQYIYIYG